MFIQHFFARLAYSERELGHWRAALGESELSSVPSCPLSHVAHSGRSCIRCVLPAEADRADGRSHDAHLVTVNSLDSSCTILTWDQLYITQTSSWGTGNIKTA